MRRLTPLSYEQHVEIAPQLLDVQDFIKQLRRKFHAAYGVNSKEQSIAFRIDEYINLLRDRLDERVFKEAKQDGKDAAMLIYYPGQARHRGKITPTGIDRS